MKLGASVSWLYRITLSESARSSTPGCVGCHSYIPGEHALASQIRFEHLVEAQVRIACGRTERLRRVDDSLQMLPICSHVIENLVGTASRWLAFNKSFRTLVSQRRAYGSSICLSGLGGQSSSTSFGQRITLSAIVLCWENLVVLVNSQRTCAEQCAWRSGSNHVGSISSKKKLSLHEIDVLVK